MKVPTINMPALAQLMFFLFLSQFLHHSSSSQCSNIPEDYPQCLPLPVLNATLMYSYKSENSTLSILYVATPPSNNGWVAWGINPSGEGMIGTQAIVTYKKDTHMVIQTYNLISYGDNVPGKLTLDVWDLKAKEEVSGEFMIYAKIKIPDEATYLNHAWQCGNDFTEDGTIAEHPSDQPHRSSKGKIPLVGDCPATTRGRTYHEEICIVAWGLLNTFGLVAQRNVRFFPGLFYVHVYSHLIAAFAGVSGGVVGVLSAIKSDDIQFMALSTSTHGILGIMLMVLSIIQIIIYYPRQNREHRYSDGSCLKIYHYTAGYIVIILGNVNILLGYEMDPQAKWETTYEIGLSILLGIGLFLEGVAFFYLPRNN